MVTVSHLVDLAERGAKRCLSAVFRFIRSVLFGMFPHNVDSQIVVDYIDFLFA
jgi:hypothetical protein